MKCTFVRGLWGVADQSFSRLTRKIWVDIADALSPRYIQPEPCQNFVFGTHNAQKLSELGVPHTLVSPHGLVNWGDRPGEILPMDGVSFDLVQSELNPPQMSGREFRAARIANNKTIKQERERVIFGRNHWRHKLECIRLALENHDAAIWIDWDVHQLRPLPSNFWERFSAGREVQAQLSPRKPSAIRRRRNQHIAPGGGFVYFRGQKMIDRVIEIHSRFYPQNTDEDALGHLFDELMGGWKGHLEHYARGYSPFCYLTVKLYQMPHPSDVCFAVAVDEEAVKRGDLSRLKTRDAKFNAERSRTQAKPATQTEIKTTPPARKVRSARVARRNTYKKYLEMVAERAAQKAALLPPTRKIRMLRFHIINGEKFERGAIAKVRPETAEWIIKQGFAEAA